MTPAQATTETPGQARVTPGQARVTPGQATRETPDQATREIQDLTTKVTQGQATKDTPGQARVSPGLATRETQGQTTRPARSRVKESQASPQSGARQSQPQPPVTSSEMEHPPVTELGLQLGLEQPSSAPDLSVEDKTARAAAARAKLRAALGLGALAAKAPALGTDPPAPAATPATPPVSNGSDMREVKVTLKPEKSEAEAEKAVRIAATKAKMREALLSAAMVEVGKVGGGARGHGRGLEPGMGQEEGQGRGQGRRLSAPLPPGRRSSGAGGEGEIRNTIWEFFEEGKKKGTCKTCGYVVATKHNHGGLTR